MDRRLSPPASSYSSTSTRRNVASYSSNTTTTSTTTTTTTATAVSSPSPASGSAIASVVPDRLFRSSSPSPSPQSHSPFSSSSILRHFSQRPLPVSRTTSNTTTVTTSTKADSRSHNSSSSTQRASKKRSPNYVKPRPADPTVISGILSSLETLTPPGEIDPHSHTPAHFFETTAGEVRPYSSSSTVASGPTVPRVPAFAPAPDIRSGRFSNDVSRESLDSSLAIHDLESSGRGILGDFDTVDYDEYDDDDDDAAAPPIVPTSRPPSGLSQYLAPRPPSFVSNTSPVGRQRRPASINSRTSSGSGRQEKDSRSNKKLSAESWVKPASKTDRSAGLNGQAPLRRQPRELRRITSQETLRPDTRGSENVNMGLRNGYSNGNDSSNEGISHMTSQLTKAEEIIARTPPVKASSKGRLFLGDTTIDEKQLALESPGAVITYPEIVDSPPPSRAFAKSPPEDILSTPGSSKKCSPARASPIVDSIPLRTSSLRQTSRSPVSKRKKDRKSKRRMEEKLEKSTWTGNKKVAIPESTWADLGEDDDTVKRIRQLREQRKERLRESLAFVGQDEVPYLSATIDPSQTLGFDILGPLIDEKERPTSSDYFAKETKLEPSLGAQRLAPGSAGSHLPEPTKGITNGAVLEPQKSPLQRPMTAATHTSVYNPDIPLEYSYTEAIDALQDLVGNPVTHTQPARNDPNSLDLEEMNLNKIGPPEMRSAPNSPHRNKRDKRPPSSRWSTHPDLPLEFDKRGKNRRKSMSDARHAKTLEEELDLDRRDSIDDAVTEYLSAPRLSQTVRHPLTGRTISFSEVGDPEGAAVIVCLGMGLTRYVTAFFDELALTLRLRLITVERPGVGASTPYPSSDRSGPLSWPDDVLAVCQHLGIGKFSLLAHSAGAIYALATALILPHLIKGKVQLLAPWIPPSQLEMISHHTAAAPAAALPRSQRILRVLPTPFLRAANSSFMTATSASLKPAHKRNAKAAKSQSREDSESPHRTQRRERATTSDRPNMHHRDSMMMMDQFMPATNPMENFLKPSLISEEGDNLSTSPSKQGLFLSATATPTDPNFAFASIGLNAAEHEERERKVEYTTRLTQRTWELATRDSNPATDLLVCLERHREVGFRYTDVTREVAITHGSEDRRVPVANVRWLADQMNRRAAAVLDGAKPPSSRDRWGDENPLAALNGGTGTSGLRSGCEVKVLEGEGHGLMASPVIMGDVLTEIAGAWIGEEGKGRIAI